MLNHSNVKPRLRLAALALALPLVGCGGIIEFRDDAAMKIQGDAPKPVAKPKPKPKPKVKKPRRAELKADKIVIKDKVQFEHDSAIIKPESHGLLDEVADVIKENPGIKKIRVEGHASSDGDDQHNMELSQERAQAVVDYLVNTGKIPKDKLVAKGFGETKPIADNKTEEGRIKNRRVEFVVVEKNKKKKGK